MEEKLRTLKDLPLNPEYYDLIELDNIKGDLRQEAIKWLKEISNVQRKLTGSSEMLKIDRELIDLKSNYCKAWIKHFFNLEEGELQ